MSAADYGVICAFSKIVEIRDKPRRGRTHVSYPHCASREMHSLRTVPLPKIRPAKCPPSLHCVKATECPTAQICDTPEPRRWVPNTGASPSFRMACRHTRCCAETESGCRRSMISRRMGNIFRMKYLPEMLRFRCANCVAQHLNTPPQVSSASQSPHLVVYGVCC